MGIENISLVNFSSEYQVYAAGFAHVRNSEELCQRLLQHDGELEYAFLDAQMLHGREHITGSLFNALYARVRGQLRTANVHAEIVYGFATNRNVSQAFTTFGLTPDTRHILVLAVRVNSDVEPEAVAERIQSHLVKIVRGRLLPRWTDFTSFTNFSRIRSYYKLDALMPNVNLDVNLGPDDRQRVISCILGSMALRAD